MNDKLKSLIKEIVEQELDEMTASGAAGPYNIPAAFRGNSKAGKDKQKQNSEKVGYKLIDKESEKADDVDGDEDRHKTFGDGKLKEPMKEIISLSRLIEGDK